MVAAGRTRRAHVRCRLSKAASTATFCYRGTPQEISVTEPVAQDGRSQVEITRGGRLNVLGLGKPGVLSTKRCTEASTGAVLIPNPLPTVSSYLPGIARSRRLMDLGLHIILIRVDVRLPNLKSVPKVRNWGTTGAVYPGTAWIYLSTDQGKYRVAVPRVSIRVPSNSLSSSWLSKGTAGIFNTALGLARQTPHSL